MTERRRDAFTGRSVLVAPGRRGLGASKPGGLPALTDRRCPFCPGHEADTEATVARWPAEGAWAVRVVRNKYPVIAPHFAETGADGVHDVVIESREHDADLPDFTLDHLRGLIGIWQTRLRALEADPAIAAALVFRNRGRRAGSSQPHPHGQIAATTWVPSEVELRWRVALEHLEQHGESVHESELRRELGSERILREDEGLASFCPWAPSRPFEVRFAPRRPLGGFATAPSETLDVLAEHLSDATRRLRNNTSITDFNLVLRTPPARRDGPAAAWHLDLMPRTGAGAGYELAGGEMIVVVTPEDAAARLRE